MKGAGHPRWKGGKYDHAGYIRISAGSDRGKYEHRVVMEQVLGKPIPEGFDVHHVDGNPKNNALRNLLLVESNLHRPGNGGRYGRRGKR